MGDTAPVYRHHPVRTVRQQTGPTIGVDRVTHSGAPPQQPTGQLSHANVEPSQLRIGEAAQAPQLLPHHSGLPLSLRRTGSVLEIAATAGTWGGVRTRRCHPVR